MASAGSGSELAPPGPLAPAPVAAAGPRSQGCASASAAEMRDRGFGSSKRTRRSFACGEGVGAGDVCSFPTSPSSSCAYVTCETLHPRKRPLDARCCLTATDTSGHGWLVKSKKRRRHCMATCGRCRSS